MSEPRRNAPCPCGSGRRYKDCHGRLGAQAPALDALTQRALEAHERGRVDEAQRLYEEILAAQPGHAVATHYSGMIAWHRGDIALAEERMRASIAADATIADFHNNLALLLRDTGRVEEAIGALERAIALSPRWQDAHNNMGLALEAAGRWDEAIAAYRTAIEVQPAYAPARQNLARVLLARGDFAAGWREYRWRLLAQGVTQAAPDPAARPLAASLSGRRFAVIAEQGLGDVLFFLRFVPALAQRGAAVAFRGDPRLHSMLRRTGVFELGVDTIEAAHEGLERVHAGDLPWLLEAHDAAAFPPPLALAAQPERVARLRAALHAQGPGPYVALTWRAGLASAGPARTQMKRAPLHELGETLRGLPATWISVQRLPAAGEREELSAALGAPVRDWSGANDDLEEMLALMAVVDHYVGVSNANAYLRTGARRPMQALVPFPPEWRWGLEGASSPWFAGSRVHRQDSASDWSGAMRTLRAALTSREGP